MIATVNLPPVAASILSTDRSVPVADNFTVFVADIASGKHHPHQIQVGRFQLTCGGIGDFGFELVVYLVIRICVNRRIILRLQVLHRPEWCIHGDCGGIESSCMLPA